MFYYMGLFLAIIRMYLKLYNLTKLENISSFFLIVCILIEGLSLKFSRKDLIFIIFIVFIGIFSKNETIILTFLFIIMSRNKNKNKIMGIFFKTNLSLFILTLLFYYLGYSNLYETERIHYRVINEELKIRESLGFNHPNTVFKLYIPIFISYVYIIKNKLNLKRICVILLSISFLYLKTYSRGFVISIIVGAGITIFFRKSSFKFQKLFIRYYILILSLFSYLLGKNQEYFIKYNILSSGRVSLFNEYLNLYKIGILGQKIDLKLPLDNSYLIVLFTQGILILTIYIFLYYSYIKKIENESILMTLVIIILTMGFLESYIFLFTVNPLLLVLYNDDIKKEVIKGEKDEKSYNNRRRVRRQTYNRGHSQKSFRL